MGDLSPPLTARRRARREPGPWADTRCASQARDNDRLPDAPPGARRGLPTRRRSSRDRDRGNRGRVTRASARRHRRERADSRGRRVRSSGRARRGVRRAGARDRPVRPRTRSAAFRTPLPDRAGARRAPCVVRRRQRMARRAVLAVVTVPVGEFGDLGGRQVVDVAVRRARIDPQPVVIGPVEVRAEAIDRDARDAPGGCRCGIFASVRRSPRSPPPSPPGSRRAGSRSG